MSTTRRNMRIGVDLGGTKIEAVVLADNGTEVARKRILAPRGCYSDTLDAISGLIADVDPEPASATPVGVGIPGTISPATGLVKNANSTWLIGHRFDRDLTDRTGRRVRVANDANCFAISEAVDGAGRGHGVVFGVIVGTGVGGAVIVERTILAGRNAVAGEWGHTPLPWMRADEHPGPACYCGAQGCIETFVSGPAFEKRFAADTGRTLNASEIAERALAGDPAAERALSDLEDRLARSLTVVVNILDPDVIVLGGGLSNIAPLYENLPGLISRYAFSDSIDTPVVRAVHGDAGGVRGAAWLWPDADTDSNAGARAGTP